MVETEFGYHVIRLADRRPAKTPEFEDVRDRIIADLKEERENRIRGRILTEIRQDDEIEVNQEAIQALEEELQR
ncbi:MAG: hypothetical protein U5L11_00355 [Arhodomonas sp.]|nr:hypothetical protein [Arhodomonas sp.]